jgi:hypothetical protein
VPPFASKAVGPTFRKGWLMTWKHFLHAKYTISGMPHEEESFENSEAICLGGPGPIETEGQLPFAVRSMADREVRSELVFRSFSRHCHGTQVRPTPNQTC